MAALGGGVLVFEDGCLRLEGGTIPIFPDDSVAWDDISLTLDGRRYLLVDEIGFGGGLTVPASDWSGPTPIPKSCSGGYVWVVVPEIPTD